MRNATLAISLCLFASISIGQTIPDDNVQSNDPNISPPRPLSFWMRKKLEYSTAILRGIAFSDFESIEESAQFMKMLNRVEGFTRRGVPNYPNHVAAFQSANDEIIRQSQVKNIDGVLLGLNQLTNSCVRCHQALRINTLEADIAPLTDTEPTEPKE